MKTCITAPEPIEAEWTAGGVGFVTGAQVVEPYGIRLVTTHGGQSPTDTLSPSPALLAFIAKAEAELMPPKMRGMGEVTREDLRALIYAANTDNGRTPAYDILDALASERNIKLPEAG